MSGVANRCRFDVKDTESVNPGVYLGDDDTSHCLRGGGRDQGPGVQGPIHFYLIDLCRYLTSMVSDSCWQG